MIRIGKIVATHGLQGDVVLSHITGKKGWLKADDVLFLALRRDSYIPFFVTHVKTAGVEEYTLHLEETDTVEAARRLIGKEAYVPEDVLAKTGAADTPLLWIGFEVVDTEKGSLGAIEDIFQTATQWLAQIRYRGKEALIPLIEQTLQSVDIRKKRVTVTLPEGLLEVYTG